MFSCLYCDRLFSNKGCVGSHQPYCIGNPNRVKRKLSPLAGTIKGQSSWNKGIKTPDEIKNKISKSMIGKSKGIPSSPEKEILRRAKISESMKNNPKSGGFRIGSGRGKKGRYKNIWCDSTWELAWVIYHIDHEIPFERNWEGFKYIYEGKEHTYYPDFKIQNTYIEIKGRKRYADLFDKDKAKIDLFKYELKALYESDMYPILEYVKSKYGKNFHLLYE